jgi:D-lactate dehydrogenase
MSDRVRIAFFDTKPYDRDFFDRANKQYHFDIRYFSPRLSDETVPLASGFDAVCVFVNDDVSASVVQQLYENGVKMVALRSAGYNNVDLKAVLEKLHVVRVPAYSPHAVAEHTLALILGLNRKTHKAYARTREGNFSINGLMGFDLNGKTAGIIGTGKIGREVIKILRGLSMEVLAYDVYPNRQAEEELGFRYTDLDELYSSSDIVSLHCPLTPENVYMINRQSIGRMKKGVVVINTGRGKLINTRDLIHGLKTGQIGGAGLDVYEEEDEYFFEDLSGTILTDDVLARLLTFPNVIITSHQAFFTREALNAIASTTLENIRLYFSEEKLPNEICYKCTEGECPRNTTGRCF